MLHKSNLYIWQIKLDIIVKKKKEILTESYYCYIRQKRLRQKALLYIKRGSIYNNKIFNLLKDVIV